MKNKTNIISVSRRTDIPAYYGEWFLDKVKIGYVKVPNPFNGKKYKVSLKSEKVSAIVFWSKNYIPFMKVLDKIYEKYDSKFLFHYTITGYSDKAGSIFEPNLSNWNKTVENLKLLSKKFSRKQIIWRYDPIIFSNYTGYNERLQTFEKLASILKNNIAGCYISFIDFYKKVKNRMMNIDGLKLYEPNFKRLCEFTKNLKQIANKHNISLFTCCEDKIADSCNITKGSCVDAEYLNHIFPETEISANLNPTREECGCYKSKDIGKYNTCKSNCLYCYANN